jgi:DNA polymerase/3'-5' exonuclease PolX
MRKNKTEDNLTQNEKNTNLYLEFYKLVKMNEFLYTKVTDPKEKIMFKHKIISLRNSSKQIKAYEDEIKTGKDLEHISGIGKGTIMRIDEFLKNKKLEEITNFCDSYGNCNDIFANNNKKGVYEDLLTVFGIGDKLAKKLIEKYKLKSVKELQNLVEKKKIELPDSVITGLKYYGKVKNNIPRSEITQIREYIYDIFEKLDPNLVFDICGSFRRKKSTSNDIDLLVTSYETNKQDNLKKIVNELTKQNFIIESLSGEDSETKFMGICKYKNSELRRLDIRYVPLTSFFPAYLYFTGSYEFNERMRGIAKRQNYKLNEYGLYKLENNKERNIQIYSEKDVFDILGMSYLEPHERI